VFFSCFQGVSVTEKQKGRRGEGRGGEGAAEGAQQAPDGAAVAPAPVRPSVRPRAAGGGRAGAVEGTSTCINLGRFRFSPQGRKNGGQDGRPVLPARPAAQALHVTGRGDVPRRGARLHLARQVLGVGCGAVCA